MTSTQFENKKIASYLQKGEGIPLVFVHGFCADSSVWNDFITLFPGRSLLRIDLPGFGNSDQIDQYSIARFAQVIKSVLNDLKIEECIFIGHSMGGYVGLELAKQYGNLLKGLCLFHSHPYEDAAAKKQNRQKSIDFINRNGAVYYVKQLIPALFGPNYRNSNHLELAKLTFTASQYTAANIIAGLEVMSGRADNTKVLSDADFPFLFIIGKEDTVVPDYVSDTALPNIASIHILENVGHMGMLERPKQCARIIKDFVALVEGLYLEV